MYDVTVIGPAVMDILADPFDLEALQQGKRDIDQIKMSFGGDALNESAVLTRLGKKVQLISKVGLDEAGRSVRGYMRKNGISTDDLMLEEGTNTSINIALVAADGSRKFLMDPHSSQRRLGLEDVLPRIDEAADIVCFASMFISPLFTVDKLKVLFARIKESGRMLIVDVTRPKNGETLDSLRELLPYIDIIVPNDEEIFLLTGEKDPEKNVRTLVEAGVGTAVVKIGGEGCLVGTKEGVIHVPAVPGIHCIDTTGAGDSFAAGLIAGLCEGRDIADCARIGCAAASCSIEQIGATDGVRNREQVAERYRMIEMK